MDEVTFGATSSIDELKATVTLITDRVDEDFVCVEEQYKTEPRDNEFVLTISESIIDTYRFELWLIMEIAPPGPPERIF